MIMVVMKSSEEKGIIFGHLQSSPSFRNTVCIGLHYLFLGMMLFCLYYDCYTHKNRLALNQDHMHLCTLWKVGLVSNIDLIGQSYNCHQWKLLLEDERFCNCVSFVSEQLQNSSGTARWQGTHKLNMVGPLWWIKLAILPTGLVHVVARITVNGIIMDSKQCNIWREIYY